MAYVLSALSALHLLVVAVTTLRLLLRENISSSARLAWFIVILTLPFVGLAIYLLLGEITLPKALRKRHQHLQAALSREHPDLFETGRSYDAIPPPRQSPFRFTQSINGFAPTEGNEIELMKDAEALHTRLIADIDKAEKSINILFYIWLTDQTGTDIANALMRAAKRGVLCRAAADNLGSRKLIKSKLWKDMRAAGVHTQIAMPFDSLFGISLITRVDLRNHRKLTVIDGQTAYIGSKNAADPAFAPKARYGPWIDVMLRVRGPVVNQVQAIFAGDWLLQSDEPLSAFVFEGRPVPEGIVAQFRGTGPLERQLCVSQGFCALFERAERELIITTPYFVPDAAVLSALQSAALRGVDVTLNVPKTNDNWIVQTASRGSYAALIEAGVKIMEHGPGLLHAKIVTVDGCITLLGSTNLDLRSFDLNFENDILIYDEALTGQIRARQQSYLASSTEFAHDDFSRRSIPVKLRDNLVATLSPIL